MGGVRILAVSTALSSYILIVFGSHVRVTESGMGCPDWPLCYGQPGPILEFHALMEQGHRYLAATVSVLVLLTAAMAVRSRGTRPAMLRPAVFAVALLGVQVLLGGVTVFAGNGSPTVALHLIGGLSLLTATTVTALCAFPPKATVNGRRLKRAARLALAAVAVLLTTGSLIVDREVEGLCPSIPFCPANAAPTEALFHVLHRGVALATGAIVWLFAYHAWRHWSAVRGARPLAIACATVILVNAGIGITSALLMAPPAWADLHLAGAAAVLVSVVSLATVGWLAGADAIDASDAVEDPDTATAQPRNRVRDAVLVSGVGLALISVGYLAATLQGADSSVTAVGSADAVVASSGHTTEVDVAMHDMRFVPDRIDVPVGDTLVIRVTNHDDQEHDLVLESGQRTPRIAPGDTASVTVDPVSVDVAGWCSIAGHRWMGMTLSVAVVGAQDAAPPQSHGTTTGHEEGTTTGHDEGTATSTGSAAADLDLMAEPEAEFTAYPAALAPADRQRVHRVTLPVTQQDQEVAPGVWQSRWTFAGSAPGPTLRGRVGDRFIITLINRGDIGHSIDFHAGALAPDRPMRTIQPGERLRYSFTATKAGIWLYHCSTMPMSMHIANGMFGAVIIDPPDLGPVDQEFLLVQSEVYLGDQHGTADPSAIAEEQPDLVVFNGYANQYHHDPLRVRAGERVRLWVLAAGPNRGTAFHVVGGQFDTSYTEGTYGLRPGTGVGGSQVLGLAAAQGGFVETVLPRPGHYPFVTHSMVDAERGAHGMLVAR